MARFVVGRGNVTIEGNDGVADMVEALVREAAPRTIEALERELDKIIDEARAAWPVGREREGATEKGRPHSRDLFTVKIVFDPDEFAVDAVIENTAGRGTSSGDYAYKIKSGGVSPWQVHVVQKVKEAEQRLADILAEELARVLDAA